MRVRLFNTLAAIFFKLGLPTTIWLWCAHSAARGKVHVRRGGLLIARSLEATGRVDVGSGSRIFADEIHFGSSVLIGPSVSIHAKRVEFGDGVQIDEGVKCEGGEFPQSALRLDEGVWIFPYCILNTTFGLHIGSGSGVGGYSMIWTHGSWQSSLEGYPVKYASTAIGKNVWLPWHVIVMPGVTIGDNVTIGAGSLVTKNIESNSLAAGVPAKILKSGAGVWPAPVEAENRQLLLAELVSSFNDWQRESFQWKELTILKSRNHYNEPLKAKYLSARDTPVQPEDLSGETFYLVETSAKTDLSRIKASFLALEEKRFSLRSDQPQHRDFVRYLSHHGLHALELNSRLPNHRV